MSHGGKGSRPRPYSVTQQEYDTRWDAIFGRDLDRELALDKLGVEIDKENNQEKTLDTNTKDK